MSQEQAASSPSLDEYLDALVEAIDAYHRDTRRSAYEAASSPYQGRDHHLAYGGNWDGYDMSQSGWSNAASYGPDISQSGWSNAASYGPDVSQSIVPNLESHGPNVSQCILPNTESNGYYMGQSVLSNASDNTALASQPSRELRPQDRQYSPHLPSTRLATSSAQADLLNSRWVTCTECQAVTTARCEHVSLSQATGDDTDPVNEVQNDSKEQTVAAAITEEASLAAGDSWMADVRRWLYEASGQVAGHSVRSVARLLFLAVVTTGGLLVMHPRTPISSWMGLGPDGAATTILSQTKHTASVLGDELGRRACVIPGLRDLAGCRLDGDKAPDSVKTYGQET